MLFDSWHDLLRILIVGIGAYVGLVLFLRITGKRTLSKMNAFDLVVTVALGSTLASTILNGSVALSEGLLAFALLCLLQFVVAFVAVRSEKFQRLIKAEPTLLFFRGRFLSSALLKERVAKEEIFAAVRSQGIASLSSVQAVVLETDGSFSVVRGSDAAALDSLTFVRGTDRELPSEGVSLGDHRDEASGGTSPGEDVARPEGANERPAAK